MENATKIALLRDEYLLLPNFYENLDTRIVTIKGGSATVRMAAIGGGFYQTHYLWLFGAAASLIFWLIEALWKSFQYMYSPPDSTARTRFRFRRLLRHGAVSCLQIMVRDTLGGRFRRPGQFSPRDCGFSACRHICRRHRLVRLACTGLDRSSVQELVDWLAN
jgi:hypothetical protein